MSRSPHFFALVKFCFHYGKLFEVIVSVGTQIPRIDYIQAQSIVDKLESAAIDRVYMYVCLYAHMYVYAMLYRC